MRIKIKGSERMSLASVDFGNLFAAANGELYMRIFSSHGLNVASVRDGKLCYMPEKTLVLEVKEIEVTFDA